MSCPFHSYKSNLGWWMCGPLLYFCLSLLFLIKSFLSFFGNNLVWNDLGTPTAKYCLSGGRLAKRRLKSFEIWSLKNTWKSGRLAWPLLWHFCATTSIMLFTAMYVLGPTEQPKSAIRNMVDSRQMCSMSRFSAIVPTNRALTLSAALPYNSTKKC